MRGASCRGGSALLGVLVLVTLGSMIGTSVLLAVDAQQSGASATLREDQSRALAWSGVRAVMSELSAQREDLLTGARPELTGEWVLFEDGLGREGVVRLIPFADGSLAQAEAGKLDINHASAETLGRLEGLDASVGGAIVAARGAGAFTSVEELLGVEGVSAAMLYGDGGEGGIGGGLDASAVDELGLYGASGGRLLDRLTVFSFDPNVQASLEDERHRGKLRLNFDVAWSDELAGAIEERFGEGAVEGVRPLFVSGTSFASDADLCRVLQRVSPEGFEVWALALDALTTSDDMYRPGRVDINAAEEAVLAAIPGFDAEIAQRIVSARESLSEEERQRVVWPLEQGIVTAEQFIQAVDSLTTRSLQYRVRIEAGWRRAEDRGSGIGPGSPGGIGADPEALEHRRVLEAVVDVASTRARVAYLRDVTMLPVARAIAEEGGALIESFESGADPFAALEDEAMDLARERDEREIADAGEFADGGEVLDGSEDSDAMMGEAGERREGEGLEDEGEEDARDRGAGRVDSRADSRSGPRSVGRSAEAHVDDGAAEEEGGAIRGGTGGLMMIDRRIGRWTSRRASG